MSTKPNRRRGQATFKVTVALPGATYLPPLPVMVSVTPVWRCAFFEVNVSVEVEVDVDGFGENEPVTRDPGRPATVSETCPANPFTGVIVTV